MWPPSANSWTLLKIWFYKDGEDARVNESSSSLLVGTDSKKAAQRNGTLVKAALYAVQVFYSFFIM
jgi:solute carrier family 31 (copper transporter), member 1